MAREQIPPPGRLIVSIIYSQIDAVADALRSLERQFGRIQSETVDIPYNGRNDYEEEMGADLLRRFFSFERLIARDSLPEIKAVCHKIETHLGDRVDDYVFRTVNIDPAILTADNLVSASHCEYNHRIYLTRGVFAEMQLVWAHGRFTRLPWTDPDFWHPEALDFFVRVRESFELLEDPQIRQQSA